MSDTPNYQASIDFLKLYHATRRWTLTAIWPVRDERPTITATFDAGREADALKWLEDKGREYNLYFAVNPPSFDVSKKTERTDIENVVALHADLDPRKEYDLAAERERLLKSVRAASPKPTCIIDSGRGFWIHYLLSEPLPINRDLNRAERAKAYNAEIANKLNADNVANIDRVARLPGTVNRKTGELAVVLDWNLDANGQPVMYKATDVATPPKETVKTEVAPPSSPPQSAFIDKSHAKFSTVEQLPSCLSERTKCLIFNGEIPGQVPQFQRKKEKDTSRSGWAWDATCNMLRDGATPAQAYAILTSPAFKISSSVLDKGGAKKIDREATRLVERAQPYAASSPKQDTTSDNDRSEPAAGAIRVVSGNRAAGCEVAMSEIANNKAIEVYRRGQLVQPIRVDAKRAKRDNEELKINRPVGATILDPLDHYGFAHLMSKASSFTKFNALTTKWGPADPPLEWAKYILRGMKNEWPFPDLKAIVNTPVMRRNGTILQTPGYDPETQLLYEPRGVVYPPIDERPEKSAALDALKLFNRLIYKYKFASPADRAVALALFLVAIQRRMMRICPAFALDSPQWGSGKGILANVTGIIATGFDPAKMNVSGNPEEFNKQLEAAIRADDPIIVLDNVDAPLIHPKLCTMITEETVAIRVLGVLEQVKCPSKALIVATGNNLEFRRDMVRRVVRCRIDPEHEQPHTIEYHFHPAERALRLRRWLVAAGLTILRAFVLATDKPRLSTMGFDDFDMIRGALVWLGEADPAETQESVRVDDDGVDALASMIDVWGNICPNELISTQEILDRAQDSKCDSRGFTKSEVYQPLILAIQVATGMKAYSPKAAGHKLKQFEGRVVNGWKLEKIPNKHLKINEWRVRKLGQQEQQKLDYGNDNGYGQ